MLIKSKGKLECQVSFQKVIPDWEKAASSLLLKIEALGLSQSDR